MLLSNLVYSEVTIEIKKKNHNLPYILVTPFVWNGDVILPEDIVQIIENDLNLSCRFKIFDSSNYFAKIATEKLADESNYLLLHNIAFKISGEIILINNIYHISYKLFDVAKKQYILEDKIVSSAYNLRNTSHQMSDNIFNKITGIKGDFLTKILYVKHSIKNNINIYQLCCADADGYNTEVLFSSKQPIISPCWSPDGKQIAYVSFEDNKSKIYIHNLETGHRSIIINSKGIQSSPDWSPNGESIALVASNGNDPNIYIIDLTTKRLSQITYGLSISSEPSWMPDGKSLLFTSSRGNGVHIYQAFVEKQANGRFNVNGGYKQITNDGLLNARARPFPDGKHIVLINKQENQKDFNIAILNLENQKTKIISTSTYEDSPSVSKNGQRILFSTNQQKNEILKISSINGNVKNYISIKDINCREVTWRPY
jgi:TolB protein